MRRRIENRETLHPVIRHEGIFDHDILAARPFQPDHVPGVVHPGVAARDQESMHALRQGAFLAFDGAAKEVPFAVVAPAGKWPTPGKTIAAFHAHGLAIGGIRRSHQNAAVLTPNLFSGAIIVKAHVERMDPDHPEDEAHAGIAAPQCDQHFAEHFRAHFVSAPAFGLDHAEQACLFHFGNCIGGNPPLSPMLDRLFAQIRHQRLGTRNQFLWCRNSVIRHCPSRLFLSVKRRATLPALPRSGRKMRQRLFTIKPERYPAQRRKAG